MTDSAEQKDEKQLVDISWDEVTDILVGDLGIIVFELKEIFSSVSSAGPITQSHIDFDQKSQKALDMVSLWKKLNAQRKTL